MSYDYDISSHCFTLVPIYGFCGSKDSARGFIALFPIVLQHLAGFAISVRISL